VGSISICPILTVHLWGISKPFIATPSSTFLYPKSPKLSWRLLLIPCAFHKLYWQFLNFYFFKVLSIICFPLIHSHMLIPTISFLENNLNKVLSYSKLSSRLHHPRLLSFLFWSLISLLVLQRHTLCSSEPEVSFHLAILADMLFSVVSFHTGWRPVLLLNASFSVG
jgi:hypothetical protein